MLTVVIFLVDCPLVHLNYLVAYTKGLHSTITFVTLQYKHSQSHNLEVLGPHVGTQFPFVMLTSRTIPPPQKYQMQLITTLERLRTKLRLPKRYAAAVDCHKETNRRLSQVAACVSGAAMHVYTSWAYQYQGMLSPLLSCCLYFHALHNSVSDSGNNSAIGMLLAPCSDCSNNCLLALFNNCPPKIWLL